LDCFVGEIDGLDLTKPMPAAAIAAIHAGMDKYAALIFHDQDLADEQQLDFTRSLGAIELALGTSLRRPEDYRLATTFADVSNLDKDNKPFARRSAPVRHRQRLWHSDSSFKVVPAQYSLLHARRIPSRGASRSISPHMPAPSLDGRSRRQRPCRWISPRPPPGASSSMHTNGGSATR
jgi:alpha-ketoglutarate-dependent 2,4-dichlorophenoxyacetate dioxygenase